jgi:hypothetical protein
VVADNASASHQCANWSLPPLITSSYMQRMLNKQQKYLQRQWVNGTINLVAAARRLGYRKASLTKGIAKVKSLLTEMGITVL